MGAGQQSGFEYQIEMIRPPRESDRLTIHFVKDGKVRCSWGGHSQSAFVQSGKVLVYALYNPYSEGCTLVAVDLDGGKELWRSRLQGG
jgi:hypothetical protein